LDCIAWGEENPLAGEEPISWQTWSDGAGSPPTVSGDPDWGKMQLDVGEQGRSGVVDIGNANERTYELDENVYGTGSGVATLQIRGDINVFTQDSAEPPNWENYTVPITRTWRYVQVREIKTV
jgi:hypothetical protein